jgi:uncharacterized membrane protein
VIKTRLLLKAISYRIFGSVATAVIAFLVTGSIEAGLAIGFLDTILKIVLYYVHELAWEKLEKKNG